jgi:hypothetical protein
MRYDNVRSRMIRACSLVGGQETLGVPFRDTILGKDGEKGRVDGTHEKSEVFFDGGNDFLLSSLDWTPDS